MSEQLVEGKAAAVVEAKRAVNDLSGDIERAVEREPLDRVRCIRLFDNYYRCNWWAPATGKADTNKAFDWAVGTTHQVRKSSFLAATMEAGHLTIQVVPRRETTNR